MNFNENLQLLRKKHNLSQEDLAEKLNVSRQSISKWESGAGYPEMDNLITISNIFKIDLETLLKGNINELSLKKVYEKHSKSFAAAIAIGVASIILTIGFAERLEDITSGPALFFLIIGLAVATFIIFGFKDANFKLRYPTLNFTYNKEELINFNSLFGTMIAIGVFNIFIAIILSTFNLGYEIFMTLIALSVMIFVYFGILKGKMELTDFSIKKEEDKIIDKYCAVIMISATIIFFLLNFIWNLWTISWVVFPIGGMLCGIVSIILSKEK
jgi:transcriptional regulator with XRE-family HTH domain